jgi:lambda family phage tail tape measure protein
MASLKYTVDVDTKGARSSIASLQSSLGGLGAAIAGGFAVGEIVAFGDSIVGLQNKLRILTADQTLVSNMFKDITKIAGAARAPLEATGDLYFKIARSAKNLGITQQETGDITESIAKSMSMFGSSAADTQSALMQLGQAMDLGRFQGDELNAVLERLPAVADAMAAELSITRGELKKLGSEGKITSDVFVRAMQKSKKSIDDAFARSVPTATQALNNLKTAFAVAMTEMAQEEGTPAAALAGLAEAILKLANDVPALTEAIKSLVTVLGLLGVAFAAFKGIALIRVGLNALSKAFIAASVSSTGFFTMFKSNATGIVRSMKAIVTGTGQITTGVKKLGGTVTFMVRLRQAFFSIAAIAGNVLRILLRFAGWVGIALAVAEAVDFLVKKFFGFSIIDWAMGKLNLLLGKIREFAEYLGIVDKQVASKAAAPAAAAPARTGKNDVFGDASTKISPKADAGGGKSAAETAKDQAKALKDIKNTILEINAAYREQATSRLEDLNFQLKSLSMSEDQIQLEQNRRDILKEQTDALKALAEQEKQVEEQFKNKEISNKGRKEAIALIAKEKAAIEATTVAQLADSAAAIAAIQAKNRAIEQTNHLLDLQQQALDNKEALQALEDQLQLVGLFGDNLEDITAQLTQQQRLREIDIKAQKELIELKKQEIALGPDRYNDAKRRIEENRQAAIKAAGDVGKAEQKITDAQRKQRNDVGAALRARFEELERSVDPAVTAVEGLNSLFSNMGTALDNFVQTGKLKFGDLAKSIIADIAKIALKAAVTKLFTLIGGAILGKPITLPKLAAGGPAMANRPYLVGEQGPELFVPNSAGSIMTNASLNKNADSGSGMGATVNNTYITNNISAIDSRSVAQMFVENRKSLLGASMMARKEMPYGG